MENSIYECKKEFEISLWDDDNDCFSEDIMAIEKGSTWKRVGTGYICDGEIRLECVDDAHWLEISKETLGEYFHPVEDK